MASSGELCPIEIQPMAKHGLIQVEPRYEGRIVSEIFINGFLIVLAEEILVVVVTLLDCG